jgi:MFS transporter, DHA1 family, multidrug resistance protein
MVALPPFTPPSKPSLGVLVAISAVQPFALNVLAPATPSLSKALNTDYGTIQLTLSLYLLTVALVQLVVGPISDRVGRRPCVLIGLAAYTIGSLLGALAPSVEMVIFSRMIQAAGAGTAFALARAIVRDTAEKDEAASRIGYLTTVMVISPMIAPLVGGYMDAHVGWRSIFALMVAIGCAVLFFAAAKLPETNPSLGIKTKLTDFLSAIPSLITDRKFLGPALAMALTTAAFFAFIAGAPYITIKVMGQTPDVYGLFFVITALGYMAGNFVSGRYAQKWGADKMMRLGTTFSLVSVCLEIPFMVLGLWNPATFFIPLSLNAIGNGLTLPSATASALSVRPAMAGTAAGVAGALQLGCGALVSFLTGHAVTQWPPSLIAIMFVCVVSGFVALRWGKVQKPS